MLSVLVMCCKYIISVGIVWMCREEGRGWKTYYREGKDGLVAVG